jgi:hypothetical protein
MAGALGGASGLPAAEASVPGRNANAETPNATSTEAHD